MFFFVNFGKSPNYIWAICQWTIARSPTKKCLVQVAWAGRYDSGNWRYASSPLKRFWSENKATGWWFGCHEFYIFPEILGISHHPNWRSHIFQRGSAKNHQPGYIGWLLLPGSVCWSFPMDVPSIEFLCNYINVSICMVHINIYIYRYNINIYIYISYPNMYFCFNIMIYFYVFAAGDPSIFAILDPESAEVGSSSGSRSQGGKLCGGQLFTLGPEGKGEQQI